jgi:hemerythrin-like domain-containing protein
MDNAAVREFKGIHNMIRGLLHLLESAVATAKPNDVKQMKTLADFGSFAVVGTHFHHSAEDDYYWPAIEKNGANSALLEPLVEEHHQIDPLLDETQAAFTALRNRPVNSGSLEPLEKLIGRFKDDMLRHLDHEEPIFFPLLTEFMPDSESEEIAAVLAKKAPRKGISWLMGGVEYGMTEDQASAFLATFPKPIQWLHPVFMRKYRKDCGTLGVDPATPSQT